MTEENPQDQQTVGPTIPKEPGEIGWHADADKPGDRSLPAIGSGGVGPYEPPAATPPTLAEPVEEVAKPVEVPKPVVEAPPAKVAYADQNADQLRAEVATRVAAGQVLPDVRDASKEQLIAVLEADDVA